MKECEEEGARKMKTVHCERDKEIEGRREKREEVKRKREGKRKKRKVYRKFAREREENKRQRKRKRKWPKSEMSEELFVLGGERKKEAHQSRAESGAG